MQDAMGRGEREPAVVIGQESASARKTKKRTNENCSICTNRIWFDATAIMEPEGVPQPRHSWILCRDCYQALVFEMRRSPIRTPLRLRIAMGIVAADRWPQSRSSSYSMIGDHKKILFIVWTFILAMIFHLALIVFIAFIAH